jgi:phosphoribosylanthranilate isomerase
VPVKVCGITRLEDAECAVALGAAALGFICWPGSPRYIGPEAIARIVQALPPFVSTVGVFVDQPTDEILSVTRTAGLQVVQLHGHEDAAACSGHRRVIKSVALGDDGEFTIDPAAYARAVTILLDAHDPVRKGGTGRTIDWSRASDLSAARRVILAGGLNAGNVAYAIARVRPYAVDVSSGVEREPGVKDADELGRFFSAVRAIDLEGDA